ncbi:hypothetical protein METBIDRAFT_10799 [Metschnikowia bicuspidata var. bicuspidata NRRL YB-4993]|uniref:Uncharacterized protein n=1 Tax=Metschnikowia bicuspidata var. bicuspidata NRRL YB-4993 TaxID=869754 RepID=A0A1A0HCZ5_9ASCO|nr:hypothetical protein METBIDRAFT_10799 [Metschnikowia bicuspidata var. bicuspidata NRRL YB-4993]OBA21881.1 hypothetical protein METBIDRAFT_10799 [Metschnikowia bicuspidata var. bicuspidata NRRL YB-4993]
MGLTDKIHSKFSNHKDTDTDKNAGGFAHKRTPSGQFTDLRLDLAVKERAALYGDELDVKAGRSMANDNLMNPKDGTRSFDAGNQTSSFGKDSYGKDSYGNKPTSTTGHNSAAFGTAAAGPADVAGVAASDQKFGDTEYTSSHARSHDTGAAVTGDHSSTARGTDLPGSSFSVRSHDHGSGFGAPKTTSAHHSGATPRSSLHGSFSTGDHSLDQKISELDPKDQTKAKEAFERGYKEAIKNHGK